MKISIIIVSWNVSDLLEKCLTSIFKSTCGFELEVFVVDNNSKDDSVEMVKEKFAAVNLIVNDYNAGFAKANNQAISLATGDYILLLNPDTELFEDTLAQSVDFMVANPACGVMGPKMLYGDKSLQPSVRRFPKPWPVLLMLLKIPKILPKIKPIENYLAVDFDYSKPATVDQVMGAYMFIRKEVFKKIGTLDEDFFIWFEEVDFCFRAKQALYQVWFNPKAVIIHYGGTSFAQQQVIKKQKIFFKSAWHYFKKHGFRNRGN